MKCQIFYTKNMGKFPLYGLCFLLIFLLSLTFSSIVMAQTYNWGSPQDFLYQDFVYNLDEYSWSSNLNIPGLTSFPGDQGRSGFQAQAPSGIQVLSARNKHILYSFWARPNNYQSDQNYYTNYQNPYQPGPNPFSQYPPLPFYGQPYWHTTEARSSIGPSMFYGETYWLGLGGYGHSSAGGSSDANGSIGPSMFYGETYWHGTYGGLFSGL